MPIPFIVKACAVKEGERSVWGNFLAGVVHNYASNLAKNNFKRIQPYLKGKILDIGVGMGAMHHILQENGYDATGVDVQPLSIYPSVKPIIYDGEHLPFKDKEYDTAIIINVLHHCSDPLKVLLETKRVAKRVVIIDDSYRNEVERVVISLEDAVSNWEFYFHPYLHPDAWKKRVAQHKWKLVAFKEWAQLVHGLMYGRYCLLVIE